MNANHIFKLFSSFFLEWSRSITQFWCRCLPHCKFCYFLELYQLPSNIFFNTAQPRRRHPPPLQTQPPPATSATGSPADINKFDLTFRQFVQNLTTNNQDKYIPGRAPSLYQGNHQRCLLSTWKMLPPQWPPSHKDSRTNAVAYLHKNNKLIKRSLEIKTILASQADATFHTFGEVVWIAENLQWIYRSDL